MGQREVEGVFEGWVDVGAQGLHISHEKKCDFDNHPHTCVYSCLNRLFSRLNVVSSIRWSRRGKVGYYVGLVFDVLQFLYVFSAGVIYDPE